MSTTHTPGPLSDEFVQSVADGPHPSNIKALAREVLRARQAAPDLLEVLRECEWRGTGPLNENEFYCPLCKAHHEDSEKIPHAENCRLAIAIAKAEGKTT